MSPEYSLDNNNEPPNEYLQPLRPTERQAVIYEQQRRTMMNELKSLLAGALPELKPLISSPLAMINCSRLQGLTWPIRMEITLNSPRTDSPIYIILFTENSLPGSIGDAIPLALIAEYLFIGCDDDRTDGLVFYLLTKDKHPDQYSQLVKSASGLINKAHDRVESRRTRSDKGRRKTGRREKR